MSGPVQPFRDLDAATEQALRASIERFGVLVPVVIDQHGRVLDGHQRLRLADELGLEPDRVVRAVADDAEAWAVAVSLNTDRRHLTPEQRREVVADLRAEGHSLRAIAGAVGVSHPTVLADIEATGKSLPVPERVVGLDGKSRPATRPKASPDPALPGAAYVQCDKCGEWWPEDKPDCRTCWLNESEDESFDCPKCGDEFDAVVWHCDQCGHHWPPERLDCTNCHTESTDPALRERIERDTARLAYMNDLMDQAIEDGLVDPRTRKAYSADGPTPEQVDAAKFVQFLGYTRDELRRWRRNTPTRSDIPALLREIRDAVDELLNPGGTE